MFVQAPEVLQLPPTEPNAQPRLLVVDDDVPSAQALQLYLTRQGYQVKSAYSGQRALEEIPHFRPHLLILDLLMPDINGFEVTMRVRSDPSLSYIPVIMITAQDEERRRLQSRLSGADDYIAKPVNELELLVRVQALLRTKHQIDQLMAENQALLANLATRNQELEEALLALHEANILKINILNAVSHEMGTPMLQVKSAVHLIVEDILATNPEHKAAQLATQSLQRLQEVIQSVVDLAKLDNIKLEPFVAKDALDLALRNITRLRGQEEAQRIQNHADKGLPPIYGDRRAVARVLFILLDNALKFDPAKKRVGLDLKLEKHGVSFHVRDQGVGIPPEEIPHIFKEFYQVDSGTTRQFGGMGVGLAVAQQLCHRMNTKLYVKSAVGEGSHFWFELPRYDLAT